MNKSEIKVEYSSESQPAGQVKPIILASFLIMFTILMAALFADGYSKISKISVEVSWANKDSLSLNNYPTWFYYNNARNVLISNRVISDSNKVSLLKLADVKHKGYNEFRASINNLSYSSNKLQSELFILLLYIAGCAAVVGVQIRSLFNFIGNFSYKRELDIPVWWPWYVLRPVMAFVVGGLIIVLAKAKLFNASTIDDNIYAVAIAAIAGFGIEDAIGRLRDISKALFGKLEK